MTRVGSQSDCLSDYEKEKLIKTVSYHLINSSVRYDDIIISIGRFCNGILTENPTDKIKHQEASKDAEIKMNMAKDIYCHMLNSWDGMNLDHDASVKNADAACNTAEFIFNRFNK